jgi:serine phosphatase RsbU (regulator of sigma subunit)
MEVQIGVAKINKYAVSESGDTLEVVERPNGGLSVVLADGQRSGKNAKRISTMVVRKVISLLAEGVRDGAAARAASDYLFSSRDGKVQSTLNILSIDMISRSLVISRNNEAPIYLYDNNELRVMDEESESIGAKRNIRPIIHEVPLEKDLTVVVFSDGLSHAGTYYDQKINVYEEVSGAIQKNMLAQDMANCLMERALFFEHDKPRDDISIVVLRVIQNGPSSGVRRMSVHLPMI